jgi:hypothetical protein
VRSSLLLLLAVSLVALAACGSTVQKAYLPGPTASCLRQHGFEVSTTKGIPLAESAAANGGLRASPPSGDNTLVIGFAADAKAADELRRSIRRLAPVSLRPRLRDIMSTSRNAVLVWTVSPTPALQQTTLGCLSS